MNSQYCYKCVLALMLSLSSLGACTKIPTATPASTATALGDRAADEARANARRDAEQAQPVVPASQNVVGVPSTPPNSVPAPVAPGQVNGTDLTGANDSSQNSTNPTPTTQSNSTPTNTQSDSTPGNTQPDSFSRSIVPRNQMLLTSPITREDFFTSSEDRLDNAKGILDNLDQSTKQSAISFDVAPQVADARAKLAQAQAAFDQMNAATTDQWAAYRTTVTSQLDAMDAAIATLQREALAH